MQSLCYYFLFYLSWLFRNAASDDNPAYQRIATKQNIPGSRYLNLSTPPPELTALSDIRENPNISATLLVLCPKFMSLWLWFLTRG